MNTPRIVLVTLLTFLIAAAPAFAQIEFDRYFEDETLRIDYYQTGNSEKEFITLDRLSRLDIGWAGNPEKTIDDYNVGLYFIHVRDAKSGEMLYSRGFSSVFGEYRTTQEARDGEMRTFYCSALIPHPKVPILFSIHNRDRENNLILIFEKRIEPDDVNIKNRKPDPRAEVIAVQESGHPHDCLDLAFVGEAYREEDRDKFIADVNRYMEQIFLAEPFKSHRDKVNIRGVFAASQDAGVDQPELDEPIYKQTILDASYNALDTPRYLLVSDLHTLFDIATAAPFDKLIVLANEDRYGGGGIYNSYTISTVDHRTSLNIFMHEFGHGFAMLADEYFGGVAYVDLYPEGVEPLEVNITRLLDPENVKWKHLLTRGVEIPTPTGAAEVEALRTKLEAEGADRQTIRQQTRELRDQFQEKYKGVIGVFEGGGYTSKGVYRSEIRTDFYDSDTNQYGLVSREGVAKVFFQYVND